VEDNSVLNQQSVSGKIITLRLCVCVEATFFKSGHKFQYDMALEIYYIIII